MRERRERERSCAFLRHEILPRRSSRDEIGSVLYEEDWFDRVSIVIPQYGRSDLAVRCIKFFFTSTIRSEIKDLEIVVVDDGSPDSSVDDVKARSGLSVKLVRLSTNGGFSTACNAGAEAASGEFLLFLNNDTVTASN